MKRKVMLKDKVAVILFSLLVIFFTVIPLTVKANPIQTQKQSDLIGQLNNVIRQETQYYNYAKMPKINLNVVNQPLGVVMQNFAVLTNYSLSFADGVNLNTPVTIRIVNTPIPNALKEILYPIGYSFKLNIKYHRIIVTAFEEKNIQIPPSILDSENLSYMFSSTGESGQSNGGGSSGGSSSTSGGQMEASGKISVSDKISGSDAIKVLITHLKSILSDRGIVSLDPITGDLFIRDYRPYVKAAEVYVNRWINQFSKEVYIKAYVIDVMLDKDHELGIDWSTVQKSLIRHSSTISFSQTATSTITNPIAQLSASNGSTANPFSLLIKALSTQGNVKVVSEPRLVIMNHEMGYIQSGDSIPYISNVQENYIGTTGDNAQTTYQISRVLEGVTLSIRPHILNNNHIDLTIIPTLSSVKDWQKLSIDNTVITNPVITTRNAYTKLVVKNGEMIVIGGAQTSTNKTNKMRVPLLGDIPILGSLFGYTQHQKTKSVMLVILQASVVNASTAAKLRYEAHKAVLGK